MKGSVWGQDPVQRTPSTRLRWPGPRLQSQTVWMWNQTALQGLTTYIKWGKLLNPPGLGFFIKNKALIVQSAVVRDEVMCGNSSTDTT